MSTTPADTLFIAIHAEPKIGKTWLAATAPKPLLLLDAEGGSRFLRRYKRVTWDPARTPPPEPGEWEICVVYVRDYEAVLKAYQWLASGKHPFRSVAIDTLTEVQKRCLDKLVGDASHTPEQQDWGNLFRHMEETVRKLRDLAFHPTHPVECLVLTAHTHFKDGKFRPLVKGQLELTLPGLPDVIGHLDTRVNEGGKIERRLTIQPVFPNLLVGDRTDVLTRQYGPVITNPNLTEMLKVIGGSE